MNIENTAKFEKGDVIEHMIHEEIVIEIQGVFYDYQDEELVYAVDGLLQSGLTSVDVIEDDFIISDKSASHMQDELDNMISQLEQLQNQNRGGLSGMVGNLFR